MKNQALIQKLNFIDSPLTPEDEVTEFQGAVWVTHA